MYASLVSFVLLLEAKNFVLSQLRLSANEVCELDSGIIGRCVNIRECPAAIELLQAKIKPKLCSFVGYVPIVCCDETYKQAEEVKNSIAQEKCEEYNQIYSIPEPPVVGGVNATVLEFPHMAILGYGDEHEIQWNCGGTLISETFVLTAAHCITSTVGRVKYINLGEHDLQNSNSGGTIQRFTVKTVHIHPEYHSVSYYHDIALIELDKSAGIYGRVKPACLPNTQDLSNTSLIVTGWGALVYTGSNSKILQKAELTYVPYEACKLTYKPQIRLKEGLRDDLQICAEGKHGVADTCQGDSGGPLQAKLNGQYLYTIVGITSFGIKCGIAPGIYTRVSTYVPWIENIVWPQ